MAEYIDKAVALSMREPPKSNRYYQTDNLDDAYEQGWDEALSYIEKIPAADVAPVIYGRWINITRFNDGERIIATCSRCKNRGGIRTIRIEFGIWEIDSPYCPNCGAKMQEQINEKYQ